MSANLVLLKTKARSAIFATIIPSLNWLYHMQQNLYLNLAFMTVHEANIRI